jgi:hypothetical protein
MQWRQGDVYIAQVEKIPENAVRLADCVLAEGEATGHRHQVRETDRAYVVQVGGERFLCVHAGPVSVTHDEHGTVVLPNGTYRFWQQREYTPRGIVRVTD